MSFDVWWNENKDQVRPESSEECVRVVWGVAQKEEREACAKVCEEEGLSLLHEEAKHLPKGEPALVQMASVAHLCMRHIRARGEMK